MKIYPTSYVNYNQNNNQKYNSYNRHKNYANNQVIKLAFCGVKGDIKKLNTNTSDCFSTLFSNDNANQINEDEAQFIKEYLEKEQKIREKQFAEQLYGDENNIGLLDQAEKDFKNTKKRTIILIDEFDRFFGKDTSSIFVNALKTLFETCSKNNKITFFLTTNNPQKIPYELRNSNRTGIIINLDPPDEKNAMFVIEHYLKNCEVENLDYSLILEKLFKYAPNSVYSNSHIKTICEIATDNIKPTGEPLTTTMFLEAIDEYENQETNKDLCRINQKYLQQYADDKENV